ncbi:MAG: sugar-transfer associated ATP-grasp domain-containing protein, partial [Coriobacteriales bacterium]
WLKITDANRSSFISERDYLYLHPMNSKYDKWLHDRISALNVFRAHSDVFEPCHFHIMRRAGSPFVIALTPEASAFPPSAEGLHSFARGRDDLVITSASWSNNARWKIGATLGTGGERCFFLDGVPFTEEEFAQWLDEATQHYVLVVVEKPTRASFFERLAPGAEASLHVRVLNKDGASPHVAQALIQLAYPSGTLPGEAEGAPLGTGSADDGYALEETSLPLSARRKKQRSSSCYTEVDIETGSFSALTYGAGREARRLGSAPHAGAPFEGVIPHWEHTAATLASMCKTVPQVEFAEFKLDLGEQGFVISAMTSLPAYNSLIPFSPEITEFLQKKRAQKHDSFADATVRRKRFTHNLSLKIRRTFAGIVAPEGLVPYQSTRWIGDVARDFFAKTGTPASKKIWAYRHGFLSYRLDQYGITEDNWKSFISDFEYRWLRHINSKYRYWLEDKITLKYVAAGFKECFPGYYYYTSLHNGENRIIPMMDLPDGYDADYESILRLARESGVLALKPDEGSHGEGFYKLTWDGTTFRLNGAPATEERVCSILSDPKNQYLITEYIQMHPQLKEIYPDSVNTIRVTVFKQDGRTPVIGNAYMRIGSSRTGFVDNLAAGGICAAVDIETGRYGSATILDGVNQGNLVPCPVHPDTGVAIEGVLPNWELAKEQILGIAAAIPQLEYFGFDVAITQTGIKLPEINRFPDFPRIDRITPELMDYLLCKLEQKKHVYAYDVEPCRKLLRLPTR